MCLIRYVRCERKSVSIKFFTVARSVGFFTVMHAYYSYVCVCVCVSTNMRCVCTFMNARVNVCVSFPFHCCRRKILLLTAVNDLNKFICISFANWKQIMCLCQSCFLFYQYRYQKNKNKFGLSDILAYNSR